MTIHLTINGTARTLTCEPHESLRVALRRAGFFSVRYGSDTGEKDRAAAVLVDGRLVSADVMQAAQADGHRSRRSRASPVPGELHPIQQAFIDAGAIQSGYSTPAMILAAKALFDRTPNPTEAEVRDAFRGSSTGRPGTCGRCTPCCGPRRCMRGEVPRRLEVAHLDRLVGSDAPHHDRDGLSPIAPRVVLSADVPATRVVGHAETKTDAVKLAKGNPAFTDDRDLSGTLIAKVLYSPHAHARIVSIDDSAARALPGVRAVLHHGNVPRVRYASGGQSYPNPLPYDR